MKFLVTCLLMGTLVFADAQARYTEVLSSGWRFHKGYIDGAEVPSFDDSDWEEVRVPHDWAIAGPFVEDGNGSTGKLPWQGEGWYRRNLGDMSGYQGKAIYLVFDGVMAFPRVYLNGSLVGKWDYGYNSFYIDITDHVNYNGENVLAVHANTKDHDSRWYPGAGLYRKVSMIIAETVHVAVWGTHVTTPVVKPHYAEVSVRSRLCNNSDRDAKVTLTQTIDHAIPGAGLIGSKATEVLVPANSTAEVVQEFIINDPRRWDVESPEMYTLQSRVGRKDTKVYDMVEMQIGIRTTRFTADNGFYLNDRRVQLKGVNLHHDHGPLGAAFNKRAMQRQLEIMKEMGVNSVRTSHNVAAPELLELCDEMGLLVFNEIFDKYDGKADITDTTDFESFVDRNMRNFVTRDRNHPSVFLWSVGNEIGDVQWDIDGGFDKLRTMIRYLEKYDHTRPVTLVCDSKESAVKRHFDFYDVHAWNYGRRYSLARQMEPNKAVVISESASTLSTRGFYEFPLPAEKTDFTESLQVSSYDLNAPWWAEVADDDFMWQQEEPYVAGEYVWTGFDYIGEPTPYDNRWVKEHGMTDREASRSSYFGIVDLCGIPKDRFWLYKSYWRPDEAMVHILPHWNWAGREGDTTPVFVYTNGDCAELYINGEKAGRRCKDPRSRESTERFRLMWDKVVYEPGELVAVAFREGVEIGRDTVRTAGAAASLRLSPDRRTIMPDGDDLTYVLVEAFDANGNPHPLAMDDLDIAVDGVGTLAGAGNGNPQSFDAFQDHDVSLFYGKAMVILRAGEQRGEILLKVSNRELGSAECRISVSD